MTMLSRLALALAVTLSLTSCSVLLEPKAPPAPPDKAVVCGGSGQHGVQIMVSRPAQPVLRRGPQPFVVAETGPQTLIVGLRQNYQAGLAQVTETTHFTEMHATLQAGQTYEVLYDLRKDPTKSVWRSGQGEMRIISYRLVNKATQATLASATGYHREPQQTAMFFMMHPEFMSQIRKR